MRWSWLFLIIVVLSGCNKRGGLQIGDTVPTVTLNNFHGKAITLPQALQVKAITLPQALQGKAITLPQALQGKVMLLRFWSLECGFCDKELLIGLESLYQKYKDRGFMPVAINVGPLETGDERLKRFDQLTYPMLVDDRGLVAKKFGVIGMPTSFVVDSDGVLREKITGEAGLDEFEKLFATILN